MMMIENGQWNLYLYSVLLADTDELQQFHAWNGTLFAPIKRICRSLWKKKSIRFVGIFYISFDWERENQTAISSVLVVVSEMNHLHHHTHFTLHCVHPLRMILLLWLVRNLRYTYNRSYRKLRTCVHTRRKLILFRLMGIWLRFGTIFMHCLV